MSDSNPRVVTEMVTLWLGSLEGAPEAPSGSSLIEAMTYVSLYNVVLRRCAKTVLQLRKKSLALAAKGSKTDKDLAKGWSLEALVTTCSSSPSDSTTSWSLFIQKIVRDAQEVAGHATFGAVLLTYYKLRSVLGQMETKGRRIGLKSVKGVKEDPLALALSHEAKRLYAKTKAALGIAMDEVANDSDEEGDAGAAYRENREVSLLMRQAHKASLVGNDDRNKAPIFGIVEGEEGPLFSEEELAALKPGKDLAIAASLKHALVSRTFSPVVILTKSTGSTNTYTVNMEDEPLIGKEELDSFKKGDDKAIKSSLHRARNLHGKKERTETKSQDTSTVATGVITRLTSLNPVATETVGEGLAGVADLDPSPLVDGAADLPETLVQEGVEATVGLVSSATTSSPKESKRKTHTLKRPERKAVANRRRHKVKASRRKGNRSSSWGMF